jgi:branched-chain amino acid transport system ATP-binding protein
MTEMLRVEHVSKNFLGLPAVQDVSFRLEKGEMISIVGPNGAGKTTLFNLVSGQLAASVGEIYWKGKSLAGLGPEKRAKLGMGRTFQIARPFLALTVLENAMVGAFLRHPKLRDARDKAMTVLAEVQLAARADRSASELTLSERRRLEVARALAMDPEIVLLDEVMAGLNGTEVGQAIELYRQLHQRGLSFLVIEHNLKVVRAFASRTIVLDHGVVLAQGSPEEILSSPEVIAAYIGAKAK